MASVEATHTYEVEADPLAAIEFCYEQGWTDGLPVIPPESSRVEAMLAMEGRPAETVIAAHPTTGLECSIQAAAVNAVMAGCLPEYFPLVIAALEAANEPGFNFHASTASTGGSATLLIVSGQVEGQLAPQQVEKLGPARPVNPEAYQAYLKGRHLMRLATPDNRKKGAAYFEKAIELDPSYAPAYAGLADAVT